MPSWSYCPDLRPYFTFISAENTAVYWPEPELNEHLYPINISVTPVGITSGDDIEVGMQIIEYTATDSVGMEIKCDVTIFVIGGAPYSSSYEYCKKESFHIELEFNDSYYKLADDQQIIEDDEEEITKLNGIIYDPMLQIDNQNCYVSAEQISNYDAVEVDDEPLKSSFLGLEAVNLIWEILVLLLIFILLCLIVDCLYRCYRDKKNAQNLKDKEQTENLLAAQRVRSEEEQNGNDADDGAGDIELQQTEEPVKFQT